MDQSPPPPQKKTLFFFWGSNPSRSHLGPLEANKGAATILETYKTNYCNKKNTFFIHNVFI